MGIIIKVEGQRRAWVAKQEHRGGDWGASALKEDFLGEKMTELNAER